jgi:hypothetical protein
MVDKRYLEKLKIDAGKHIEVVQQIVDHGHSVSNVATHTISPPTTFTPRYKVLTGVFC